MAKQERTSKPVASKAAKALNDPNTSARTKSIAASVVAQAKAGKSTSSTVATKAAKAMVDGRSSRTTKSFSGSALTQRTKK